MSFSNLIPASSLENVWSSELLVAQQQKPTLYCFSIYFVSLLEMITFFMNFDLIVFIMKLNFWYLHGIIKIIIAALLLRLAAHFLAHNIIMIGSILIKRRMMAIDGDDDDY